MRANRSFRSTGKGDGIMQADKFKVNKKFCIIGAIIISGVLFRYLGLDRYLTLEYLKSAHATFFRLYEAHRFPFIAAYMGIYIVTTAMSLPGATVLTLAGGGIFGLVVGTVVVSFASTIGATLACLASRFLLRDWIEHKFRDNLVTVNEGIAKEGAFYLFSLRLVPLFPFFIINLVMGLTRINVRTFFWVSQVGMLPATIVYINAGKEL
ncbi:MAG: TVP38/TMEM64 family protein, partial [Desulfobulbaceae bacterium]|nr:TVP38/TMEM64 family protein [Desulfobulbaceae bacterium]